MKKLLFTLMIMTACLSVWADNSVTVSYSGTTATVTIDDNVAQYLTVTQSGAHVFIEQSSNVTEEITYTLTGTSSDGEFYMSGNYKATIELNGLTLTNTTPVYSGATIHIQNGKRINVKVITGTTNTLTDAASGSQNGCLYVKGHAEFKQYGTLNVVGNVKHGIKAGDYLSVKNATINITSAVGDGISCNQYFLMESGNVNISGTGDDGIQCDLDGDVSTGITANHEDEDSGNIYISGGSITINCPAIAAKGITSAGDVYISDNAVVDVTTTGKGMWDTTDLEAKSACGISADRNIDISGGTLTLTATGSGGKGMKCDTLMTISGGTITVATSGGLYYNNGTTENLNYSGNTDNVNTNYYTSPKGIKAGTKTQVGNSYTYSGGLVISGGIISVTTQGNNAEGIESKNYLNINGGQITVDAHDDAINSAQDMTVTDGYVYARSSNNDGMDANGNMFIQGGLIYAVGANTPEVAIDANTEENKKFYFTGGTLIAIGGLEQGSSLSQTCYQASSWSTNTWYSMTFGSTIIAFKTPSSGGNTLVVSAASTPTLKSGITVNGGTSIFEGRCYLDATVSGGSAVSLSEYTGGGGGTNPPGPGQNYTITATANPTAGGTVSGAGTYRRNATCTLIATANSGYTFVNWTRNGSVVSTNATYSFQVTGNASFVANFTQSTYTVTATANPTEGGSITGTGTYNHSSFVTLTATANEGYTFINWTENGEVVSTSSSYNFVVTTNRNLVANFEEFHPGAAYLTVEAYTPDNAPVNEEIPMSIRVKNVGGEPTDGITTVTMTCGNSLLSFTDGIAEFDALSANESINLEDAFSFIISEEATNGTQFQIDVEMACDTEIWTGNVYVTVNKVLSGTLIGDGGDATNQYLPSFSYYKHTLSQQIYTVEELGAAGAITSIAFYNGGATKTRTYDFYMKATEKSTFSGTTDWVTVSESDKVFSGEVTMTADEWTLITFDTPFVYDGVSNMVLVADDNSGAYTNAPHMACRVFDAPSQALYVYSDNTNYNPLSPPTSYNGWGETYAVLSVKNQLLLFKEALSGCLKPTQLTATEVTGHAATVTWTGYTDSYLVQLGLPASTVNENFDDGIPSDWTNDATYPWTVVNGYIQSGNAGMANSSSTISATIAFPDDGTFEFDAECNGEGTGSSYWDKCIFSIDGQAQFTYSAQVSGWNHYTYNITAGEHTFTWSYTKDNSVDPTGDYFAVDNIVIRSGETDWDDPVAVDEAGYTFNNLSPLTTYCVRVKGVCDSSDTGWSETVLFTTTEVTTETQTISLSAGANWFSTYIEITLDDLKAALLEVLPNTEITIQGQNNNVKYNPSTLRWTGRLTSLDVARMYKISVDTACVIVLEGMPVNPADHPVTISNGANWIAFPLSASMTLTEAFAGFAQSGDKVQSQSNNASYNGARWSGRLTTLEPGRGYIYQSSQSSDRTLMFP